jgi:hypothetical protein
MVTIFKHTFLIADVPPAADQTKNFDYCINIVNLARYPNDLIFVNVGSQLEDPQKIDREYVLAKSDRCIPISGYLAEARIATISKDLVKSQDLIVKDGNSFLQNLEIKKSLIRAETTISRPYSLPIIYAGSKVEDSVRIDKLDRQSLVISMLDRSPIDRVFQSLAWIAFPLIGLGIFGWLMFRKRQKKSSKSE